MVLEQTERDKLIMISTKLDDHIAAQASDMSEIKAGITRIDTKLDLKVSKDEIDKVAIAVESKADKEQLNTLDNRFWAIVLAIIVTFIGLIATALKAFLGKV